MENYFIQNLKYLTTKYKTQYQLAKEMNVKKQSVFNLLKTNDPRASTLLKISEIFKISIDDLLKCDLEQKEKGPLKEE